MTTSAVNQYGDTSIAAGSGHGIDIASQRADELDQACLSYVSSQLEVSNSIRAADIGCGHGAFALRMARLGAHVECLDLVDQFNLARRLAATQNLSMRFFVGDIQNSASYIEGPFSAILSQRTIHYLDYQEAITSLAGLREMLTPSGKLFISASGISSELGTDYSHLDRPVAQRKAKLSNEIATKHRIYEPVCLYSESDMHQLLTAAGFTIETIYSSPFGNVKAIAKNG